MKLLVLGGAGAMGQRTVIDLRADPAVTRITVADRNIDGARALAERLGGCVEALHLDANDHDAVVSAMTGYDVVASALGPFFVFEARMIEAALEAGVDYISICDEWDVVADTLAKFDERARAAGRRVITGVGASPGVSNIAAAYLIEQLRAQGDEPKAIEVAVFIPLDAGCGPAAVRHGLHIMSGKTQAWRDGKVAYPIACSESRKVDFGGPGTKRVWNMGHAEPVTLPLTYSGLERADFVMGYGFGSALLVWPAKMGLFNGARTVRFFNRLYCWIERLIAGKHKPCTIRVEVHGVYQTLLAVGSGTMTNGTGLALSIGARMLGRQQLSTNACGVLAPEACFEPEPFLRELAEKGMPIYSDLGGKVLLLSSSGESQ